MAYQMIEWEVEGRMVWLDVKYDYQPAERGDREYPGCSSCVDIYEIASDTLTKDQVEDLLQDDELSDEILRLHESRD